jgi:hypothetical protein
MTKIQLLLRFNVDIEPQIHIFQNNNCFYMNVRHSNNKEKNCVVRESLKTLNILNEQKLYRCTNFQKNQEKICS